MFAPGRPDSAAVRARLQALTPRWVPTEADLEREPEDLPRASSVQPSRRDEPNSESTAGRHSLPDSPRPVWRLDASAARGLLSLTLAGAAGALVMVVVGWPRGEEVRSSPRDETAMANILVEASASPSEQAGLVVVDVDGKVEHPGVVELSNGSRVIDAIKAAGGTTRHADTGSLNLAEILIDGQQVVIPSKRQSEAASPAPVAGSTSSGSTPAPSAGAAVSINSASATELEVLPGIGPVLAAAIVDWRTQNGGFTSIEQLQEVSGIGPATYAELAPLVRL
ncbi:MAG: helix-hairpin-helix domain-containing protein [Actinomycetes bacterium]